MHAATQLLAQRATPATRTKSRFQPYVSMPATSSLRSPAALCLKPSPSVPSPKPPLPYLNSSCEHNRQRQPTPSTSTQTPKEPIQRDGSKQKFAVSLIDQAVKSLSEIWRPQDIPHVFLAPTKGAGSHTTPSTSIASLLVSSGNESDGNLLPLRSFVHEVLKRSRTSGSILQTALCYLEAVRPKIPETLRDENKGIRSYYQPESTILPATEAELQMDKDLSELEATEQYIASDDSMKTVRITDHYSDDTFTMHDAEDTSSLFNEPALSTIASSTSSLPSPLLCPRRTFLAALILASKFSQDKCYSNRAWAKLSGLPPREIGRCERALGQALDWRLWVGKSPVGTQSPTLTPVRTVVRSQSEGTIASPSSSRAPFLTPSAVSTSEASGLASTSVLPATGGLSKRLSKSATLPAESFASRVQVPTVAAAEDVSYDSTISVYQLCPDPGMDSLAMSIDERKLISQPTTATFIRKAVPYAASEISSDAGSSPDTPSLSYSPSTTDCSSNGDRTIQMSTFEDGFPSFNSSQSWLETSDSRLGPVRTASPASFCGALTGNVGTKAYLAGIDLAAAMYTNVKATPLAFVVTPHMAHHGRGPYLWHAEGGYESTSVH